MDRVRHNRPVERHARAIQVPGVIRSCWRNSTISNSTFAAPATAIISICLAARFWRAARSAGPGANPRTLGGRHNLRHGRRRSYPGSCREPQLLRELKSGDARQQPIGFDPKRRTRAPASRAPRSACGAAARPPGFCSRKAYSAGDRLDRRKAIWRAILVRNVAVGRKMSRSATSAEIIAKALSHPNRRSDGRLEKTVIARPQASTAEVKINGGPTENRRAFDPNGGIWSRYPRSASRLRK